jgi:hypothetical protein
MFVGPQRIAKSIGGGHTDVVAPQDRRVIPIMLARFGLDLAETKSEHSGA